MQRAWLVDEDKCTFIVLSKQTAAAAAAGGDPDPNDLAAELAAMAGDVNLFFNDADDRTAAEIDIMIAEPAARRQGLGREAVLLMAQVGRPGGRAGVASAGAWARRLNFAHAGASTPHSTWV